MKFLHKFYLTIFSIFISKPPKKSEIFGVNSTISHADITSSVIGQKPPYSSTQCLKGSANEGFPGRSPGSSSDNIVCALRSRFSHGCVTTRGRVTPLVSPVFARVLSSATQVWSRHLDDVEVDFKQSPFYKGEISENQMCLVCIGLQIKAAKFSSVSPVKLTLDKPIICSKNDICLLVKPESVSVRVIGSGKIN